MSNPLLARFIPEARELLQTSAGGLLKLERNPADDTAINEVFRAVHTLKGSSGLFEATALTRLVHAAEDLLGAVRAEQLQIDSSLVDMLLDSLDQVSLWIDQLEEKETLPPDADGVAQRMAVGLRDRVSPAAAAAPGAASAQAPAPGTPPAWLDRLPAEGRRDAFRRACEGEAILAVRYEPDPGCFYNGTDPLSAILQVPGILAFAIEAAAAWDALADLDPYQCNLNFSLLTAAPPHAVEQAMRYELDRVSLVPVSARDLIRIAGEASDGPIWEDFRAAAAAQVAAGAYDGLAAATAALRSLSGPDLWRSDALDWLAAAIGARNPDRALVAALVEAVGTGSWDPAAGAAEAGAPVTGPVPAPAGPGSLVRTILASQRRVLDGAGYDAVRLSSVAAVVGNVLASLGLDAQGPAFRAALDATHAQGATAPLLAFLDSLEAPPRADALAPQPSAAPADPGPAAPLPPAAAASPAPGSELRAPSKTLKIDQAKIDLLMNLIGELVVSKNALPFLAKRAEDTFGSREMAREIKEQYAVIDRLAQEMQGAIMQVRMLPVSEVFDRFPRLVRDLARKLGKRIDLAVEGEDTAADKTIVEALGDPLLHIVRNSLDHGIELPEQRAAAGKAAAARITLKAFQEADSVVIEVRDDGRGIDPARIRAAAVAKGMMAPEEADRLSDQEAINLIYRPGFSTAQEVSDLSGRGVGMDVVLTTIEKLGGQVSVTSRLGEGTTTRLALPLSMAVTRIMIVEAADGLYGVPMDMIVETVRVPAERIRTIKRAETFVLRDAVIPLVRMAQLLRMPDGRTGEEEEAAVLVCLVNGRRIGLVIDQFREGMDVILKPLEGVLAGIDGFSGTTLLGDGRVLLVLDLKELL